MERKKLLIYRIWVGLIVKNLYVERKNRMWFDIWYGKCFILIVCQRKTFRGRKTLVLCDYHILVDMPSNGLWYECLYLVMAHLNIINGIIECLFVLIDFQKWALILKRWLIYWMINASIDLVAMLSLFQYPK